MTLHTARVLLFPLFAVGRLFVALALATAKPTEPRRSISTALLFVGSTFTNGAWLWALDLSDRGPR